MDVLRKLFEGRFGCPVEVLHAVQGDLGGSGRKIVRLSGGGHTAIGVSYHVREENAAFLEFSRHFRRHNLPVPMIYAEDLEQGAYLEEDLGNTTLFEFLSKNRSGEQVAPAAVDAYRRVIAFLPRFQVEAARDLNYKVCYPRDSFDRQSISWDLNYFKYYFLRLAGIAFNEQALEQDFGRLTRLLLNAPRDYFLYRDFQSRNVLWRDESPWFVDYQGGRKGALQYDVASLLYDAKADLPPSLRQQLLDDYLAQLARYAAVPRDEFLHYYYAYVYVRIMQAMGAYGFRGFYERKGHFLQSVPYALNNLRWLLANVKLPVELPALMEAFESMLSSEALRSLSAPPPLSALETVAQSTPLTVRVFSFSYRGGLPGDDSGNGGGYVFDARALPNPGREEQFKSLTGQDQPVIDFLEKEPSVRAFLDGVTALIDASVAEYRRRGFRHLMVSFGCTGGQHRSVYLAERLASHLRQKEGVIAELRHLGLEAMGR